MKNNLEQQMRQDKAAIHRFGALFSTILFFALSTSLAYGDQSHNGPYVVPVNSKPFGQSYREWAADFVRWIYSIPADRNPFLTENCTQPQHGKVWFIGGQNTSCRVPKGKAIFVPLYAYADTYPCPYPFGPAPGQSLEDFLIADARGIIDSLGFQSLDLYIDGRLVVHGLNQRATTRLFTLRGHPSLTSTLDVCVTGNRQHAVADGYWAMIVGLSRGKHILHFESTGGIFFDLDSDMEVTIVDD